MTMMKTNGGHEAARSAALVVRDDSRSDPNAFEPRDFDGLVPFAKALFASRLLPKGIATWEAALAVIVTGREFGLTAMQSIRSIHCFDGKVGFSADLTVGLVKKSPLCKFFQVVESTDKIATYTTHRDGDPKPTTMSFTWDEATKAGLTGKDNWKKYPAAMLRARASTTLARAVYQDVVGNLYDPDEIEDVAPRRLEVVQVAPSNDGPAHEGQLEPTEDELGRRILEATTLVKLGNAGNAIGKSGLPADALTRLREAYKARKEELQKPRPVEPRAAKAEPKAAEPPHDPETGEVENDAQEIEAEVHAAQYDT